jgi:hypothetical protein
MTQRFRASAFSGRDFVPAGPENSSVQPINGVRVRTIGAGAEA